MEKMWTLLGLGAASCVLCCAVPLSLPALVGGAGLLMSLKGLSTTSVIALTMAAALVVLGISLTIKRRRGTTPCGGSRQTTGACECDTTCEPRR